MNKITSFTIDHTRLNRGIYVSRKDEVGGEVVTTFDVRMKLPNREPALGQGAIHPVWKDRIVYWGPMGCLTGNYLIVKGDLTSRDVLPLMQETFEFIAQYKGDIPGATERDCGNYLLQDLPMARYEAQLYLDNTLNCATEANLNYPG